MSDRMIVLEQSTGYKRERIKIYMDGESGTWRLFLDDYSCADFSLDGLRAFGAQLEAVIRGAEENPETFDAELRLAQTANADGLYTCDGCGGSGSLLMGPDAQREPCEECGGKGVTARKPTNAR